MLAKDLEAALTGARLVEEAGSLLTLGEEPGRMVAHAFERLSQLVPYDLATVLLREGDGLRVARSKGTSWLSRSKAWVTMPLGSSPRVRREPASSTRRAPVSAASRSCAGMRASGLILDIS